MIFLSERVLAQKQAKDFELGERVYLQESGGLAPYIVVQHLVSTNTSYYDSTAIGTWLMREFVFTGIGVTSNPGNETRYFKGLPGCVPVITNKTLDSHIHTVSLKYFYNSTSTSSGTGRFFRPAQRELGGTYNYVSGTPILYFSSASARKCYDESTGAAISYATRDSTRYSYTDSNGDTETGYDYYYVSTGGEVTTSGTQNFRPFVVIDFDTPFDKNGIALR